MIEGGADQDIVFGDNARIAQAADPAVGVRTITSVDTTSTFAGGDTINGGLGDDFIVGQQGADTIHGNENMDMIFGDQAEATLARATHQVKFATTTDPVIGLGAGDFLYGDDGEDYVFGGVGSDEIHGGDGVDVLLGDHGKFDATLPVEHRYESIFISDAFLAAGDEIHGGAGADMILGQQGADTIHGDAGEDDVTGGHDVLFGADGGDTIFAGDDSDVVLGDNGRIVRKALSWAQGPPYVNALVWKRRTDANADILRSVQRFDDVDGVSGHDVMHGDGGDDQLHGQRGDDTIEGGEGQDEIHGDQGDDKLYGNGGDDTIIGDVGHFVRAFNGDGTPRVHPTTQKWLTNVVLEEQAYVTSWLPTYETKTFTPAEALALLETDMLVSLGAYSNGCKAKAAADKPWETVLMGLQQVDSGDDELHGGDGDDILIGQRGNDKLFGDAGSDFLYGDSLTSAYHYDSTMPLVAQTIRLLPSAASPAPLSIDMFGAVISAPLSVMPEQSTRVGAMRVMDDSAVGSVLGDDFVLLLGAVGAGDLTRTDTAVATTMKAFATIVPDAIRHEKQLYGNDELSGGAGNDVLVGDFAVHHALVDLHVPELEKMQEAASTRWADVQFRLTLLSADLDTYQAQEGTLANPAVLESGKDVLHGGDDDDMLAGDGFEAYVGLTDRRDFLDAEVEVVAKDLMLLLSDYDTLAVDALHCVYEAHHAVVKHLYLTRNSGTRAADYHLNLGNDVLNGDAGADILTGDTQLTVYKGIHGSQHAPLATHPHLAYRFDELLDELQRDSHAHIDSFARSPPLSKKDLKKRAHWDRLPRTNFGNDNAHGGEGADSLVGDFSVVAVTTFDGAPFAVTTPLGLERIDDALDEHLRLLRDLLRSRILDPKHKNDRCKHSGDGFEWTNHLECYMDKDKFKMDEPLSGSMSDTLSGDAGDDLLSGNTASTTVNMWKPTKARITHPAVDASNSFHNEFERNHWKWLHEYYNDDKYHFDHNTLIGGTGQDLIVDSNGHAHWSNREAEALSGPHELAWEWLEVSYDKAARTTALGELAIDSVAAVSSPLAPASSHVFWWPGAYGVVRSNWTGHDHGESVHGYHGYFSPHAHTPSSPQWAQQGPSWYATYNPSPPHPHHGPSHGHAGFFAPDVCRFNLP